MILGGKISCQDIIAMDNVDKNVFNKITTGDATCCFAYDSETKRQSPEWAGETFPRPNKLKCQRSYVKNMLINFFRFARCGAQRNRTRRKNSKYRNL